MKRVSPNTDRKRTEQYLCEWRNGLGAGERMWRFDGRHARDVLNLSRAAFRAGDLKLARDFYYDRYGLGTRHPRLFTPGIEFVNQNRQDVARGCRLDRLLVRKEGRDLPGGTYDWLTEVCYPTIFIPLGHENQYALDLEECQAVCDELPDYDMNLVVNRERRRRRPRRLLMTTTYTPYNDIDERIFYDSDNPEDRSEIDKAVRLQKALDQLLDRNHALLGLVPPARWPHDDLDLAYNLTG